MNKFKLTCVVVAIFIYVFILKQVPARSFGSVILYLLILLAVPVGYYFFTRKKSKDQDYEKNMEFMKNKIKNHLKNGDYD
ncbi:MAG: hypothetical protein FWG20_04140 [Candidatus Cloacimonetes bacterium]|nr:hypothetical protein [Candidatus Cloacimonadota bacterium]